ncbi:Prolyl 4-hydroxylase 8 [Zea mays]|uniref:Prolyl 4-hydroxylase 8 n=2 Tax=Zea mays TaxID=4577 RepID=A0A1D6HQ32_MAIZE|nr:Prolyl 4-hydroxylase 8 [Zea mays]
MDLYACDLGISTGLTLMYALQTHWSCILCSFVGGEIIGISRGLAHPCSFFFFWLILADLAFFHFSFSSLQYPNYRGVV